MKSRVFHARARLGALLEQRGYRMVELPTLPTPTAVLAQGANMRTQELGLATG